MCIAVQPVLALLGHRVAGNPTQFMMERAFHHHQLDWRFLSLEVPAEMLADAVRGMRAMGFRGGCVTAPHKEAVGAGLDRLGTSAQQIGVVNCIVREEQALVGENTEGRGFLEALRRRIDPAGKRAVVLGAGRMARAIAVELAATKVAEVQVVSRNEVAGRALVDLLTGPLGTPATVATGEGTWIVPAETGVLVNATSADPETALPLALDNLAQETVVADVTLNAPRTWLLHEAAERGCTTISGLEMFIEQAAINFRLWTGIEADRNVLREAVEEFLEL